MTNKFLELVDRVGRTQGFSIMKMSRMDRMLELNFTKEEIDKPCFDNDLLYMVKNEHDRIIGHLVETKAGIVLELPGGQDDNIGEFHIDFFNLLVIVTPYINQFGIEW